MRDSEQQHPLRRPHHNGHQPLSDDDETIQEQAEEDELQLPPRRSNRGRPITQFEEVETPALPHHRVSNALLAGVLAGVLCALESIIIVFANTATYQQAGKYSSDKLPLDLAYTLVGIACLSFFIALLIYLIAGFITGKLSIQRRLGFLAGFVAGIVTYAISFLLNYIPNYPGNNRAIGTGNAGLVAGGIAVVIVLFLIWGIIGGLVSLLGVWLATRRHPYYVGY